MSIGSGSLIPGSALDCGIFGTAEGSYIPAFRRTSSSRAARYAGTRCNTQEGCLAGRSVAVRPGRAGMVALVRRSLLPAPYIVGFDPRPAPARVNRRHGWQRSNFWRSHRHRGFTRLDGFNTTTKCGIPQCRKAKQPRNNRPTNYSLVSAADEFGCLLDSADELWLSAKAVIVGVGCLLANSIARLSIFAKGQFDSLTATPKPCNNSRAYSLDQSSPIPANTVAPAIARVCVGHNDTPIRQIPNEAAPQIVAPSKQDRQTLTNLTRFRGHVSTEARRRAIATADESPATATDAQIGSAQHQESGICSFVTRCPSRLVVDPSVFGMVMQCGQTDNIRPAH